MLREAERLSSQTMDEWRPYYPDEIAWLYNECGVFSLAQGQSFDALSMFDAALRFAGRIEGKGDSPNRRRILLNLALCAINRGRLNEARRWLAEVESGVEEDEAVRLVAKGFKGILHYIGGEHDEAMDHYGSAIRGLTDLGRSRAVSMFLRHRGDLHRHKRRFEEANQDFSNAIDHARFSGSEDMAWFAIVAKTRMEAAQKANFKALVKRLEGAEAYADAMELPQLSAEASFVHAQILLRQGETALAAERASRALRIATLNGLTIRAIACRSLLSDIHRERGWEALAQKIKADALQAARNVGYRALLQRHANDSSVDDDNSSVPFGPNELIYKIT
jgi:tetratricopeptide (TPR) repeat protein